jgi:F0F1-type ATP synthase membrane subunit b/b'
MALWQYVAFVVLLILCVLFAWAVVAAIVERRD